MNAILTENQHYVPEFLIKGFLDSDGRAFRFGIQNDELKKRPSKFTATRANFNELLVEGEPKSFETQFQRVETAAAPVVAQILRESALTSVTPAQRYALAKFMIVQSFRTDAYRTGLALGSRSPRIGDHMNRMWASVEPLTGLLLRRFWALLKIDSESVFYLGDNPMVLQSLENPGKAQELGFDIPGVEAFMPLSPKIALYMPCRDFGLEIINAYQSAANIMLSSTFAVNFNGLPVIATSEQKQKATRILGNLGPLYRALTLGHPLQAEEANVENLNYLQCAWASLELFSNRADFSFAQRVFRENPQYRKALKVREMLVH